MPLTTYGSFVMQITDCKTEKGATVVQFDICNFGLSKIIKFKNIEGWLRMHKLNH